MKTVLFIDKWDGELWASFQKYDYLLDKFREEGLFDVCAWNAQARSVDAAIPTLSSLLPPNEPWQAMIVTDLRQDTVDLRDDAHFDNPFDFPESYARNADEDFHESERSLVRLTQMLGGVPESILFDHPKRASSLADTTRDEPTLDKMSTEESKTETIDDPRLDLMMRYRLGQRRPERILCLTPRNIDEAFNASREEQLRAKKQEMLRNYQGILDAREQTLEEIYQLELSPQNPEINTALAACKDRLEELEELLLGHENEAPRVEDDFWVRNEYPASARFVVLDRLAPPITTPEGVEETHKIELARELYGDTADNSRSFWFDFWMGALSLMVSQDLVSEMSAYGLYSMRVRVNEGRLALVFGEQRARWTQACRLIDERFERDRVRLTPSEFVMTKTPDTEVHIPVSFDLVNTENLYTDSSDIGLFRDWPSKDLGHWLYAQKKSLNEFRELLRAPRRALRNTANRFRNVKPIPEEQLAECVLNDTQCDRLNEELRQLESDLAKDAGSNIFDFDSHEKDFNNADANVRATIEQRATRKQSLIVLGTALVAIVVGFFPYFTGFAGGRGFSVAALVATVIFCLGVVVVFLATLQGMRMQLRSAYVQFNTLMRRTVESLTAQASSLETRISNYATFRKKWALADRQTKPAVLGSKADRLNRHRALLKTRIQDIDEMASHCAVTLYDIETDFNPSWERLSGFLEDAAFYRISDDGAVSSHYLHDADEPLFDAPYSFITEVALRPIKTV